MSRNQELIRYSDLINRLDVCVLELYGDVPDAWNQMVEYALFRASDVSRVSQPVVSPPVVPSVIPQPSRSDVASPPCYDETSRPVSKGYSRSSSPIRTHPGTECPYKGLAGHCSRCGTNLGVLNAALVGAFCNGCRHG